MNQQPDYYRAEKASLIAEISLAGIKHSPDKNNSTQIAMPIKIKLMADYGCDPHLGDP